MIKVGEKAPNFKLKDQHGKEISLNDFKGKRVLLSWHPLAWTSVCTDQMRALERNFDFFAEKNVVPIGLSIDHQPGKKVWANVLSIEKMSILADFHPLGGVTKEYGLFNDEIGASQRAVVLVGEDGNVEWAKQYELGELPDIHEIMNVVKK